jgi:hypothetical protein
MSTNAKEKPLLEGSAATLKGPINYKLDGDEQDT